jgi:predicted peroxiredoxin
MSENPQLKVAVVIFENEQNDFANAYRGLLTATEFMEAGDEVTVLYDGSGVDTLAAASASDHKLNPLVEKLRPVTRGACAFCVSAHGVEEPIKAGDWPLLTEYKNHASLRHILLEGYQVLSF